MAAVKAGALLALDGLQYNAGADDAYVLGLELNRATLASEEVWVQVNQRLKGRIRN